MVRLITAFVVAIAWAWPGDLWAADAGITFHLPRTLMRAEEVVPIEIHVHSGGQQINAAEITLRYSHPGLTVVRVSRNENVFPLWAQLPTWDPKTGTLVMAAGRPGGLVAVDALFATVYVRAATSGLYQVVVDPSRSGLYLHDGQGTRVSIPVERTDVAISDPLVGGLQITSPTHPDPTTWYNATRAVITWEAAEGIDYSYVLSQKIEDTPDEVPELVVGEVAWDDLVDGAHYFTIRSRPAGGAWSFDVQRTFLIDTQSPQPFRIEILRGDFLSGHDQLSWNALDVGSGVVRSEFRVGGEQWRKVSSPLPIEAAWAGQRVSVRLVDAAGNTQLAQRVMPGTRAGTSLTVFVVPVSLFVVIMLLVAWRSRKKK